MGGGDVAIVRLVCAGGVALLCSQYIILFFSWWQHTTKSDFSAFAQRSDLLSVLLESVSIWQLLDCCSLHDRT